MRLAAAIFLLVSSAGAAQAQTAPVLPRNEAVASLGWFGADYHHEGEYGNGWHPSLLAGVGAGRYWTDHLKTEVEAAWLSRVHTYAYERATIDGVTAEIASEYKFHTTKLSVAQVYQFGRNAWVHPFIGTGTDVDWLRTAEDRPAPGRPVYFANGQTKTIPVVHEAEKTILFHPFVKAGFKWYLSERASFISEWKFGFHQGFQHALWKSGFGVDF